MKLKSSYKSFDEILRAHIDKNTKEREKFTDNQWWWASDLGLCQRKQFFRRLELKATESKEYGIQFLGRDGTALHEWRQKAAKEMDCVVESEYNLKDKKLRYKGRFDILVKLKSGLSLIDIKSQRSEAFWRRKKLPLKNKIQRFQKLQLASYVYFAKRKWPELEEARLYFVDRGSGVREEYIFHFNKKIFDAVLTELKELNDHWTKEKFPDINKDWLCRYCPYRSICKEVDKEKLTVKQTTKKYAYKNKSMEK